MCILKHVWDYVNQFAEFNHYVNSLIQYDDPAAWTEQEQLLKQMTVENVNLYVDKKRKIAVWNMPDRTFEITPEAVRKETDGESLR